MAGTLWRDIGHGRAGPRRLAMLCVLAFLCAATPARAAVSFRSASHASALESSSLSLAAPSWMSSGDVMVATVVQGSYQAPVTISSSGWTLIRTTIQGTQLREDTFYRVVGTSEPSSYTFNLAGGANDLSATIVDYSGVDYAHPIDVSAGATATGSGGAAAPSLTTAYANELVVVAVGFSTSATGVSVTPGSGVTGRAQDATNSKTSVAESGDFTQATAAATPTPVATPSTVTSAWSAQAIALIPTLEWSAQTSGSTAALSGVSCPSAGVCWGVGAGGTILATTSGGASWSAQSSGATAQLNAISCADTSHCVAVGNSSGPGQPAVILTTANGGASWSPGSSGTTQNLNGVSCPSAGACWAVGMGGTILVTTNGGASWSAQSSGVTAQLNGISCPTTGACFAAGNSAGPGQPAVILATINGDTNWSSQPSATTQNLSAVACASASACWAGGQSGTVVSTLSRSSSWSAQTSGSTAALSGVSCPSAGVCWGVGAGGIILATTNGGAPWSAQSSGVTTQLNAISCADTSHCVAVGNSSGPGASAVVLTTGNGGASWSAGSSGTTQNLNRVSCPSAGMCWAVGAGGTILATTSGGASWSAQSSGVTAQLNGISCADTSHCVAVGNSSGPGQPAVILATVNGGASWSPGSSGTTQNLNGVSCPSAGACWAVGMGGTILVTTNGGASWSAQSSGATAQLNGISCPTTGACFAAGNSAGPGQPAVILATVNGGTNWSTAASGTTNNLRAVSFPATGAGAWAVGDTGTIVAYEPPPAPTITSAPASPGNNAFPFWTFSGETGASFQCELTYGANVISSWASCSSSDWYFLYGQPDGTYTFLVRQTDQVGVAGPAASSDYVLDTTPPAAPTITSAPVSPGSGVAPSWSFTGEAGASFRCQVTSGATVITAWQACSSPYTASLAGQPDGTYTLSVEAIDQAGNIGPATTGDYVLYSPPAAPTITSAPVSPGSGVAPSWSFTGQAGASFRCQMTAGATVISAWQACSSPYTASLAGQPDGTYTLSVEAIDQAGNIGPATTGDYSLDTTPPAAPTITSAPGAPGLDVTPSWAFTGETGATFQCRLDLGATQVSGWSACASPQGYDLSAQPNGTYTFSVRAIDLAGNVGAPASADYVLTASQPGAPTITQTPGAVSNNPKPAWFFAGDTAVILECRVDGPSTVIADWAACTTPQQYDLSVQPDGTYTFSVRARDVVGNLSPVVSSSYVLDRVPPPAPLLDSSPPPVGNSLTPRWTFSGETGATFLCALAPAAGWAPCTSPAGYDLTGQADATYDFEVIAVDAAGNRSTPTSRTYTLDTTPPAAPQITSAPADGGDRTPTWSFTGESGGTFSCRLSNIDDWSPCTSPRTYALAAAADGTYQFSVRETDAAGNVGPESTSSFRLISQPPSGGAGSTTPTIPPSSSQTAPPATAPPPAAAAPPASSPPAPSPPTPSSQQAPAPAVAVAGPAARERRAPSRSPDTSRGPRTPQPARAVQSVAAATVGAVRSAIQDRRLPVPFNPPAPAPPPPHRRSHGALATAEAVLAGAAAVAKHAAVIVAKNAGKTVFPGSLILIVFRVQFAWRDVTLGGG